MKRFIAIFVSIIIAVVAGLYGYFTYQQNNQNIAKSNLEFEYCYNKEIYGAELTTIINKAIQNNEEFNIIKNNKGFYEENGETSIKIEIKITDNNTTYNMETFYMNGIDKFVEHYNIIKFKCTEIKYHPKTKRVSYLHFEQVSK